MLEQVRKILLSAVKGTEFEGRVYFAGGCVRDDILGRKTVDIDLTVDLPDGGIHLAEHLYKRGVTSKPIVYRQFGTAFIKLGTHKIELVMTRKESYRQRSRKPEVEFGTLEEDVLRRDFTVNSLLMRISDGKIIDLCGKGLADIKAKLIRATSPPEIIFKEDPLRLLRAIRFATVLDFAIEKNTFKYIKHHASALKHISHERIAGETLKIIENMQWLYGLRQLAKTGLKSQIFPGLRIPAAIYGVPSGNLNLKVRLALLLYKTKNISGYLKSLKLAKAEATYIRNLVLECRKMRLLAKQDKLKTEACIRKGAFALKAVEADFTSLYLLSGAFYPGGQIKARADRALLGKISRAADQMRKHRFSLTGDDLIRTFCIKRGPEVGKMLTRALEYWFEHPQAGKTELLESLRNKKQVMNEK
jgi:tRNA nucleotidyltransferase/poly(A) polymerase